MSDHTHDPRTPTPLKSWRTGLAMSNGAFHKRETYDEPATGRRLRRMLERQAKKAKVAK